MRTHLPFRHADSLSLARARTRGITRNHVREDLPALAGLREPL
jgi:hypothetical protein